MKKALFVLTLITTIISLSFVPGFRQTANRKQISCNCGSLTVNFGSQVPGDALLFANQTNADCFAWAEFISLNWPTSGSSFGQPLSIGAVQWETYITREGLYTPDGSAPLPWGNPITSEHSRLLKRSNAPNTGKLLQFTSKFDVDPSSEVFDSSNIGQAFPRNGPNWLGAQNGTNVWYEVRLNKDIYDYVVSNKYYNAKNQADSTASGVPIVFPKGSYNGKTGAIELKAAWMEVNDLSNPKWKRYKLSKAVVVDPNTRKSRAVVVALVGLHILHKTEKQPQWVWATFEQIDNVPSGSAPSTTYNFFNPACTSQSVNVPAACLDSGRQSPLTVSCTANQPPGYYLCPGGPGPKPVQVTRTTPIDATATQVNQTMQAQIRKFFPNSVWQYYQLVNVIWSTNPSPDPSSPLNVPFQLNASYMQPTIPVANTTLETYIQGTTCTGCHTFASVARTPQIPKPRTFSDFSFAIGTAGFNPLPQRKVK
jgi:hypothetical protein